MKNTATVHETFDVFGANAVYTMQGEMLPIPRESSLLVHPSATRLSIQVGVTWETAAHRYPDGLATAFSETLWLAPERDHVYLVELRHTAGNRFHLSCVERRSTPAGVREGECPVPSEAEQQKALLMHIPR